MATYTYQPDKVVVSFGGIPITGYAPDTFVSAARNNDTWSINVGSGSDATRTKSGDKSGRVEVTLLAESASNAELEAQRALDELTGTGLRPLFVKDLSGGDTITAGTAWVVKPPDQEKGNTGSNRVWIFETGDLEIVNAGIPSLP
jgi:hypothetical protein